MPTSPADEDPQLIVDSQSPVPEKGGSFFCETFGFYLDTSLWPETSVVNLNHPRWRMLTIHSVVCIRLTSLVSFRFAQLTLGA